MTFSWGERSKVKNCVDCGRKFDGFESSKRCMPCTKKHRNSQTVEGARKRKMKAEKAQPISRQRKYQLKCHAEGLCQICGKPAISKKHCEFHRLMSNAINLASYHKRKGAT